MTAKGVVIPFATIKVSNENTGTYSDDKGYFNLICEANDTLEVTAIGYEKAFIFNPKENLEITLSERIELLDEVVITPQDFNRKTISLGNFKKKSNGGFLGEYASMLEIKNKEKIEGEIIRVSFRLYKSQSGKKAFSDHLEFGDFDFKETLVRLLLFEKKLSTNDSLVPLIKSNITQRIKPKDKVIEFELGSIRVVLPKSSVYVGIEMLGYYEDFQFIPFNSSNDISRVQQFRYNFSDKHDSPLSWTKHTIGGDWKLLAIPKNSFFNFNYGIVVREYKSP